MKTIEVLGLGDSLSNYKPNENETIGVNDIFKRVHTDYLVCVDFPRVFSEERLQTILTSKVKKFFSHLDGVMLPIEQNWKGVRNFKKITLGSYRGDLSGIDKGIVPQSNNSTFCAVCIAYHLGADRIIMHGVDFSNHPKLSTSANFERAMKDFRALHELFQKKKIELFVSSDQSRLSEFIPVYQK